MLHALGVASAARKAMAGASRLVIIEQDGLEWTETTITSVITKTTTMMLDDSPCQEMSPVDKTMVQMTSHYDEDGACVATRSVYSDGAKSQEIRRYILEDGKVCYVK